MVKELTQISEFREVINSGKPVVIDFWATWCGPCKAISPKFESWEKEYPGVEFYKVDVDEAQEISEEAKIKAMPTFIFFKDGNKVDELVGAVPAKLESLLKKAAL